MKTKLALSAIAAAVAVFSQGAFAQASSPSRAEVKAEAKGAAKAPVGEAGSETPRPSTMSDKTRAERKATTKMDKASGNLKSAGEASGMKDEKSTGGSTTTRAERKAKTRAANKSGQIPEAGEKGSADAATKKP
jgi:hypothetical protein